MTERPTHRDHFVAEWREYLQLTQEQLADKAEVTHGTISRLERGKIELTAKLLRKLARAMGVKRSAILEVNPLAGGEQPVDHAAVVDIWDRIPESNRDQAARVLETFATPPEAQKKA